MTNQLQLIIIIIIIIIYIIKNLLFLSDFSETSISRQILEKNSEIPSFMKIRQWELSCFMRAHEHDEANSRFTRFWERTQHRLQWVRMSVYRLVSATSVSCYD